MGEKLILASRQTAALEPGEIDSARVEEKAWNPEVVQTTSGYSAAKRHWFAESSWILLANLAQAAGPALGILLLARLGGLTLAGQFALAQALTTPVVQLLSFQVRPLLLTHSEEDFPLASAMGLRVCTLLLGLLAVMGFAFTSGIIPALVLTSRLIDSVAELYQTHWQRAGHSPRMALGSALRCASFLTCLALVRDLPTSFAIHCLVSVAILVGVELPRDGFLTSFDRSRIVRFTQRGALLGLVLFLQAMQANLPRLYLERFSDAAALGLFASLGIVSQLGNLAAVSYGQAMLGEFAGGGLGKVFGRIGTGALAGLALLPLLLPLSDRICRLLTGTTSLSGAALFEQYCYLHLLVWPASIAGCALTAKRIYGQQIVVTAAGLLVSAVVGYGLISEYGVRGAGWTQGISAIATLLLTAYFLAERSRRAEKEAE